VGVTFLPFGLKVLVLFFVFLVGVLSYFLVDLGCRWIMTHFMGSMWFLGFITTSPLVGSVFSLGNVYYVQEFSWMELFSGKGFLFLFSSVSALLQKGQGLSFSQIFSLFTLVFGWLVFVY
jgi:hypothetical protein